MLKPMAKDTYTCPKTKNKITIDYERDSLLDEEGLKKLHSEYMREGEESPQQTFARASCAFGDNSEHAQRLYDYCSQLWFMFATPLLANGGTGCGLPISCFLSVVDDSIDDLLSKYRENGYLAVHGGGIGNDFSQVRSMGTPVARGGQTPGVIPFIVNVDSQMRAYHQGMTRRGSAAVYLDVSHPEIEEFLRLRKATETNGDSGRKAHSEGFNNAVNIPDSFMEAVSQGLDWDLIDPHTRKVTKTVSARDLWKQIIEIRMETGEPYLHFQDTSNAALNPLLKEKGLQIHGSNLCNEIFLPTDVNRTAVCCLSSINLRKWREWEPVQQQFIEDLMRMLDNALDVFCEEAPAEMWRAVNSVKKERSVGLGTMGFQSLLQSEGIPFESEEAVTWNKKLYSRISFYTHVASLQLGKERGVPEDLEGSEERFAHRIAIAPNASSSIICGNVSPSIEPYMSNAYNSITSVGTSFVLNKDLKKLLQKHGKDTPEVWSSITFHKGSVQHLDFLSKKEKGAYKTAFELDQNWIIRHAADRQPHICQGQSLNLFFRGDAEFADIHQTHKLAWESGLKGLYYLRSTSIGELQKEETPKNQPIECVGCEG